LDQLKTLLTVTKHATLLLAALGIATALGAQTTQEITTGTGYKKQGFINLTTGTETVIDNTSWDIAFTVYGFQDAGIHLNEGSGTSMGAALPRIEIFDTQSTDFSETPDPALVEEFYLLNDEASWAYGALNEGRNLANPFDYGWGVYNPATNSVTGSKVFLVKLRDGSYRKLQIQSLVGTTYTFRYANLNGTNEVTKTINKTDHAGKTLAYFSFTSGNTVAAEPATGFDLTYTRYITPLYDPGSMTFLDYNVTGILSGRGVEVAKANGVDVATVDYADWVDSLSTRIDALGYEWKAFSGTAWSVDEDLVFFVRTANDRVFKLHFIDFEGSATGTAVLEKTDLGIISGVSNPAAVGLKTLSYPNPVSEQLYLSLDVPIALAQDALLQITDLQGRPVLRQQVALHSGFQVFELPAANWAAGLYTAQLVLPNQTVQLGKVVKN
jgi:hypothetical protein